MSCIVVGCGVDGVVLLGNLLVLLVEGGDDVVDYRRHRSLAATLFFFLIVLRVVHLLHFTGPEGDGRVAGQLQAADRY